MTSIGDNTTVVGERDAFKRERKEYSKDRNYPSSGPSHAPADKAFLHTVDYTLEERPFFVPIGKGGLIAALQRLDKQLIEVRTLAACSVSILMFLTSFSREEPSSCQARFQSTGSAEKSPLVNLD